MKQSGFDACSNAGNHWLDQGQDGIDQSNKILDKAGVIHDGANPSAAAQRKPVIINVKGVKLGFLAFTTDTNGIPLPHPWSVNMAKPSLIRSLVKRDLKAGADAVIVNLHFASAILPQYTTALTTGEKKLAEFTAGLPGVAAVVGQGPHDIQKIDWGLAAALGDRNLNNVIAQYYADEAPTTKSPIAACARPASWRTCARSRCASIALRTVTTNSGSCSGFER